LLGRRSCERRDEPGGVRLEQVRLVFRSIKVLRDVEVSGGGVKVERGYEDCRDITMIMMLRAGVDGRKNVRGVCEKERERERERGGVLR